MGYKASNNADTTLSESITPTSTTIAVATGHGDDFPALGATDWTLITITDKNGAREIIKIIARSGDTMTVGTTPGGEADVGGRAQEGTTALSITYTDDHSVRCCPTAGLIEAMADYSDQGDLTATPAELSQLHESGVVKADLVKLHNITSSATEINQLHGSGVVKVDLVKLHNITLSASQINAFESLKNDFEALRTCFSGSSAPGNPVAGMWWYDTTANMLKLRNEANNAWLNVYDFANGRAPLALLATNCSRTVVAGTGVSVSGSLASSNVTVGLSSGGVGATQLADSSVSQGKMVNYTAGDRLLIKSVQETTSTLTTYIALKQIRLDRGGTLRISFKLRRVGDSLLRVYGRVYRNGSAVGTERSTTSVSGDTYTQDISGWSAGDRIQVYGRTSDYSVTVGVSELRVSCGNWYGLVED